MSTAHAPVVTGATLAFDKRGHDVPGRHRGPEGHHVLGGAPASSSPSSGPSGCGKSTLLRIASGLTPATAGSVTVDRDSLGYVFQDATLLPWRNVASNVELLAELHGVGKNERRAAGAEAIDLVGLTGFENTYPKQLSGGMKMRASLARSLTLEPEVFLFDEPFGALDEITRERLNDELLRLFVARGLRRALHHPLHLRGRVPVDRVLVMSARPGRIVGEFDVPFPYPRSPELRFEPAFAELTGAVSARPARSPRMSIESLPPLSRRGRRRTARRRRRARPAHPRASSGVVLAGPRPVRRLRASSSASGTSFRYVVLKPKRRFLLPPPHQVIEVAFLEVRATCTRCSTRLWLTTRVAMIGLVHRHRASA